MDERARELDRLYREEGPVLWDYLRRHVADRGAAEEIFQETFVAVAEGFEGLAAARSPRAWLLGIGRNLLREHVRRAARTRSVPLSVDQPGPSLPDEDPRLQTMRQAIGRLPDGQREVLEMRLGHGLTYAEIAEALGIPVGTVRSRLHNAVGELRRRMEEGVAAAP